MRRQPIAFYIYLLLYLCITDCFSADSTSFSPNKGLAPTGLSGKIFDSGYFGYGTTGGGCDYGNGFFDQGPSCTLYTNKRCPANFNPYILLVPNQKGTQFGPYGSFIGTVNTPGAVSTLQNMQICVSQINATTCGLGSTPCYKALFILSNFYLQIQFSNSSFNNSYGPSEQDQFSITSNNGTNTEVGNVYWILYCLPSNVPYPGTISGSTYTFSGCTGSY